MDGTHRRETITRKYQLRFAGFVILLLLGCGIIIVSICGAGLCGSSDSVESTKASRDILQAPKMRSVLTTILGKDYFDGVEESGQGYRRDLTDFLRETRQKSFDWIINQDPLQLEHDAPNLVQRFLLVLFYYQQQGTSHGKSAIRQQLLRGVHPPVSALHWKFTQGKQPITSGGISGSLSVMNASGPESFVRLEKEKRWNQLNGPLPWEITQLPQLKRLHLHRNLLTGVMPQWLFTNQPGRALEFLSLDHNQLSGPIPARWFEGTAKLTSLKTSSNRLTGRIPSELGLIPWENLSLGNNSLTGSLPVEVFHQGYLKSLYLHDNDLTGTLPSEVGLSANLEYLYFGGNSVSGSLPSEIGLARQMRYLQVSYTNMQGTLPEELYELSILLELLLDSCNFSGTISSSLAFLTDLEWLVLSNNNFHGPIPNEVGELTNLRLLQVTENELTGTVPESLCQNLAYIDGHFKVVFGVDCLPSTETGVPTIECAVDCCTMCCDNTGYCLVN
ncbi:STYKc [Seminavis robusta]|uniref:STYKc n=1 Tax=Seminavis robusta TaxID=568900 RepID=A0A9N8DZZ4_9STRA|nr:STYKc [Seminavis robusta]|eukprot:Sro427_g140670.1 STYKc (503) ;mRNA; f:34848-36532